MKTNKTKIVLIAMDYDVTSQKVAEEGYEMAHAMNAETILLHVVSELPFYYYSYSYAHEFSVEIDMLGDLNKSAQKFLDKAKKHLGDNAVKTVLRDGEIAETILKTAAELNADIIVMGSHSRKWLEDIIMGSEAAAVLKKTTLPLFIVPTKKID